MNILEKIAGAVTLAYLSVVLGIIIYGFYVILG